MLSDNLALLSYGAAGEAPPRLVAVAVAVPAGVGLELTAVRPRGPAAPVPHPQLEDPARAGRRGRRQAAAEVTVELTVDCGGAPNDIYAGVLSSADGAVSVAFRVAIDELGRPVEA